MPGFDAAHAVEPLDYDLAPYVKAKGRITEPSDAQISKFLSDLQKLFTEARKNGLTALEEMGESPSADDVMNALDNLDTDDVVKIMGEMTALYSELCSGKPSAEELSALPMRVRSKFFAWLQNEVISPEAGTAAGAQVVPMKQRSAGG